MLLTCPDCKTRYLLPAHTLAPGGRHVKCTHCGAVWQQEPDPDELREEPGDDLDDIPDAIKPLPPGSGIPRVTEPVAAEEAAEESQRGRLGGYIAAAVVFLLIFAGLAAAHGPVVRAWPSSMLLYRTLALEATPGEGLVFDRLQAKAEKSPQGGGEVFVVEGQVINLTRKPQAVPMIEASLRTEKGEALAQWLIAPPEEIIAKEGTMPFRAEYRADHMDAKNILVRFVLTRAEAQAPVKTAAEDDGNNPAPHPVGQVHPHGGATNEEPPAHGSAPAHPE
jgi:predicted Zn finger-like uncharacterized protein